MIFSARADIVAWPALTLGCIRPCPHRACSRFPQHRLFRDFWRARDPSAAVPRATVPLARPYWPGTQLPVSERAFGSSAPGGVCSPPRAPRVGDALVDAGVSVRAVGPRPWRVRLPRAKCQVGPTVITTMTTTIRPSGISPHPVAPARRAWPFGCGGLRPRSRRGPRPPGPAPRPGLVSVPLRRAPCPVRYPVPCPGRCPGPVSP